MRRGERRAERAREDARRHRPNDLPVHRAVLLVSAHAGKRGEENHRHRGAERHANHMLGGQRLRAEGPDQKRHGDRASADAEKPGEEADHHTDAQIREQPFHNEGSIRGKSRADYAGMPPAAGLRLQRTSRLGLASGGFKHP
jgi:hypothetical protein